VERFIRGKMADKVEENAHAHALALAEASEPESEDDGFRGGLDVEAGPSSSPMKKSAKKKVTTAGMQLPDHWPWEEAKKLFLQPDVVKGDDLEVSGYICLGIQRGNAP
jgi:flap endonuclease-1